MEYKSLNTDRITFKKDGHTYLLDNKPITGVTTILGVINKPALLSWAAGCAVDYINDEVNEFTELDRLKNNWRAILRDAKNAYAQKRDKAADTGSQAHEWIERWIKGESPAREDAIGHMTDNFVKWAQDNKVVFYDNEFLVFSENYWYCGTADMLCEVGGKLYLGDIKTSSGIYPEMFYQCAAYRNAIEEMSAPNELPFAGSLIVNCKKDGSFDWQISTEYEDDRKAFMGALAIYRRQQMAKRS